MWCLLPLSQKARPEIDRLICTLPTPYKLFSTLIHNRLCKELDSYQVLDPGGFWKNDQTTNHLISYRQITQKSKESEIDLSISTVDFQGAFDSIELPSMWRDVSRQSISEQNIEFLLKMYD